MWELLVGIIGLILTVVFTAAIVYLWIMVIAFCFPLIVVAVVACVSIAIIKAVFDVIFK